MSTEEANDLKWIIVENPPGQRRPKWQRSACIDREGTVYAPAAITGNEMKAMLCATWDGNTPMVESDGHIYLPTQWMASEYPDMADVFELIERKAKAHFAS